MIITHNPSSIAWLIGGAAVALSTFTLSVSPIGAEDWPRYLGAKFHLTSTETDWSHQWPPTGPRVLWRANLGPGASSMVTRDGRLHTIGNVNDRDIVYGFDAQNGKELWRHTYACPLDKRSFEGGPASTPTVDEDRLYTLSHQGDLFCLNAQTGAVLWQRNVRTDFNGVRPRWGYAGSPLIIGNQIILDIGGPGNSTIALDKVTGNPLWRSGADRAGYSTPVPFQRGNQTAVLVFKARDLVALHSQTGDELWRHPWKTSWDVNAAAPMVFDNRIFLTSGYGVGCAVLEIKGRHVTEVWKNNALAAQFNTPVVSGNHVYGIHGNAGRGNLKCVALDTGQTLWISPDVGCGSLKLAGDRLIVLSEHGDLIIASAQPNEYRELARAKVLHNRCWVVPVLSHNRLYCRDNTGALICLDLSP